MKYWYQLWNLIDYTYIFINLVIRMLMFKKLKRFLDWFIDNIDDIMDIIEFIKDLKKEDENN